MKAFLEPAGDDADNAPVPALAGGQDQGALVVRLLHLAQGAFEHGGFDLPALGVQRLQALG